MFEIPTPGLFLVHYREPADLDPVRQDTLIEAVRAASKRQSVALVFVIGPAVRSVDFGVPMYWLKVMADPTVRISAMAMVTDSKAVEIAAKSFGTATRFRKGTLDVKTFADERAATAWARGMVAYGEALNR